MKNCDRGLENAARGRRPRAAFSRPRSQFFTIRTDPKPVNNLFFFFCVQKNCFNFCKHKDKISRKRQPWPVGRYRRILPALTTNQNAGFVTVPSENKIKTFTFLPLKSSRHVTSRNQGLCQLSSTTREEKERGPGNEVEHTDVY